MGSLIHTRGTQRLARLFNDRFDKGSMPQSQAAQNAAGLSLAAAFADTTKDLLKISDLFLAQNAGAGANWPNDGDDFLYPSATMTLLAPVAAGGTALTFTMPASAKIPDSIVATAAVSTFAARFFPRGTQVQNRAAAAGVITVNVTQGASAAIAAGENICFTKGNNEQLVRRWRWYLKHDLQAGNHAAIQRAMATALAQNSNCIRIGFQAIEDTQRVLINVQPQVDGNSAYDGSYKLDIILVTHQTTAPDPIDPQ